MIDSHIHLDFFAPEELGELLESARNAGVQGFIVPAASPRNWSRVRSLVESVPDAKAAFGIHPWFANEVTDLETTMGELRKLLSLAKVVALGECGLDRARATEVRFEVQERIFRAQLGLARELSLPVILHAVRAVPEVVRAVSDARIERALLHGFVGSYETAKLALDRGLSLGIGARALEHEKTRETLRRVPSERLLLETDAPDARFSDAARGVPCDLLRIARSLAALREVPFEGFCEELARNARGFFALS